MLKFHKRKSTDFIAIHCSATRPSQDVDAREIGSWHRARGWLGIGYHYVIKRDGTIEIGRPVDTVGAHVAGFNHNSVGICLAGGVTENNVNVPENNFTEAQFVSLGEILNHLENLYPHAKIQGHRDFPNVAKACPSFSVADWLKAVREM